MTRSPKKRTKRATKEKTNNKFHSIKKEVDGITFDSIMESNYYLHLKELEKKGEIVGFQLQPEFELLQSYKKYGRTIRGIKYISDFLITYPDSSQLVVDVKGKETPEFMLKRKLFDYLYPDLTLKLVTYDKKTEQWVDYDELKKTRARIKKEKNLLRK